MSNRLEELHRQYKHYYLKQYAKIFALVIAVGAVIFFAYFTLSSSTTTELKPKVQAPVKIVKPTAKKEPVQANAYTLDVSDDELDAAVEKLTEDKKVKKVQTHSLAKTARPKRSVAKPVAKVDTSKKVNLFEGTQEERSLESWIEKYNQKKSYAVAIYISKQYYFNQEYKQAGIWAKRANQLDRNKEEAWLYYAKSVYALGDSDKAKRILNIFLQYKKSLKAELLLSEWSE